MDSEYKDIIHKKYLIQQSKRRGISRYGQVCLQHWERGVSSLLSILAADDGIGQTMPLFGLGSLRKAGERLANDSI